MAGKSSSKSLAEQYKTGDITLSELNERAGQAGDEATSAPAPAAGTDTPTPT